jgi:putative Ca2+/H+ antiporter (TMEM165/GDT1 family)
MSLEVVISKAATSVILMMLISKVSGAVFIFFGLFSLLNKEKDETNATNNEGIDFKNKIGIFAAFSLITLAELADKTQLAVMTLVVEYSSPVSVALGLIDRFAVTSLLGVALGNRLSHLIFTGLVQTIAALTFLAIGMMFIFGSF